MEGPDRLGQLDGRQPDVAGAQHRRRHHRRRPRRPLQADHRRRPGRDPRAEEHRQHDGRSALVVCRRSHPRRPRSRLGGQARRPGRRARRGRHVEGPHRLGQLHGRQPDEPGAQHRRGHDGRRQGRPDQEDHRRCPGRDPRAEEHRQHDGRSALVVCRGSHARRPRGRHRRGAGRPGGSARRRRHVEGPHRQRQPDGRATSRCSCATSRRSPRPSPPATSRRRSPSTCAASSCRSRTSSTRWSTSCDPSPRKSPAWRAKSGPKANWAARRRCKASPGRGRTSPTTST